MGSARTDAAQLQRSLQIRITQTYNAEGPLDGSNRKVLPSGTEARVAQLENYLDLKTRTLPNARVSASRGEPQNSQAALSSHLYAWHS